MVPPALAARIGALQFGLQILPALARSGPRAYSDAMSRNEEFTGDGPHDESLAPRLPFPELVALTAAVMALNALAIDMMLPALGLIGKELGAAQANDRQLIVVVYVLGNGIAQLFFGPIVDHFGRRKVLLWALAGYIAGSVLSIFASSFTLLLAARAFQGVTTAATRVASIALVRDQCSGRRMAEVMSLAISIFMAAPILAPSFGQLLLIAAPWRGIFVALLLYGVVLAAWVYWRAPETLPPGGRNPFNPHQVLASYAEFATSRVSLGYTLAGALVFAALFGYISTSEQIFIETFDLGAFFPIAFAAVAIALAAASLLNARLVGRFGMRRLAHAALLSFVIINIVHLAMVSIIGDSLVPFILFTGLSFFCLGLIGANMSSLALQPMGHIAGAAAAANGFAGTTVAGFLGGLIGRFYDGTTTPVVMGFTCLGISAFAIVLWTERGRLFHSSEADAAAYAVEGEKHK